MSPTKIRLVLPRGADILCSNIEQVNAALATGASRARLVTPDWYNIAAAIRFRDTLIVQEVVQPNG